ncbi:response regulator [Stakelama sp. CBK3Z-3]|uniref:Response regulator n=1 Tax=Stakelama flava TaxID=2860338 RepID=A0ABS6XPD2_9SPHN|nr:response regulator [Stakelama flava]MBW4331986.1 response regulator [Stakelama flava]
MNAPTSPARILIVDDSEDSADITAMFLEEGGFDNLTFARSASEAFRHIHHEIEGVEKRDTDFDLIIMDIVMPEMDGIEACARLRLDERSRQVPILMLTGARDVQALNQAFVAGANDFVGKPVNQIDLLARVRTLLRLGRELARRRLREAELEARNHNLQRGALDATLIDPVTRLARDVVVELTLRSCREHDDSAALALVQVDEFDLFRERHGAVAADALMQRIAEIISEAPGPMAAMPCHYGDGAFMLVQPRAQSREPLGISCTAIRAALTSAEIPHGNSMSGEFVTVSTLTAWGTGEELGEIAARLLSDSKRQRSKEGQNGRIQ